MVTTTTRGAMHAPIQVQRGQLLFWARRLENILRDSGRLPRVIIQHELRDVVQEMREATT